MFKALKDEKIIAISEQKYVEQETEEGVIEVPLSPEAHFPCLVFDEVVEDTEHTIEDYVQCDGEFVLKTDEKALVLKNKERAEELHKLLQEADYWGQKYLDGEYTEEEWTEKVAIRKAWREEIRELKGK